MLRALLIFWLGPIAFFWGWYFLSLNDWSLGFFFFSRELHDQVFRIYGAVLGVDPAALPGMVAHALVYDSLFVLALFAFRQRRAIRRWIEARRQHPHQEEVISRASLSKAP
ncbi:DUF6105 family protein [Consotaella salsifontis]|uniref:Uncharacterized protein n=1 Tax=Consotaella salsifontis TaxID=1365950 RepID=A0A1T4LP81_9HYPH|nr:DUF6105 family protein [Consotaella salsifontis]SJZ56549.1 hypothetical protein SAMN05428963_101309 [Consotaella salsifontis]